MAGMRVALLERRQTGKESSWAGGGILSPLYPWRYAPSVTALASWSQAHDQKLSETLATDTGIDPEWTGNGLLILSADEEKMALAWGEAHGRRISDVTAAEVARLEPALAQPAAGIWLPDVAQIRNPRLVKALHRDLVQRRVLIREGVEVSGILARNGRVSGVSSNQGNIQASHLVLCAGAWSGRLLADTGLELAVEPVRGQMILFHARAGTLTRITLSGDRYAIPRRDGRVLFGSTLEKTGFDQRTTVAAGEQLRALATQMFPCLDRFPIELHWAGLRPGSPRGIPFIGPHPQIGGLYVNAGHFRNGVVLGPASARLMADIILERPPILPAAPYLLESAR